MSVNDGGDTVLYACAALGFARWQPFTACRCDAGWRRQRHTPESPTNTTTMPSRHLSVPPDQAAAALVAAAWSEVLGGAPVGADTDLFDAAVARVLALPKHGGTCVYELVDSAAASASRVLSAAPQAAAGNDGEPGGVVVDVRPSLLCAHPTPRALVSALDVGRT